MRRRRRPGRAATPRASSPSSSRPPWSATARAFVTGYYEPEIAGSRTRRPGFEVPVYAMPPDLVRAWPAETPPEQRSGRAPLGRYDAQGRFVPYYDRAQIEDGALAGRGLEIAWAADPVELFFLQIQGSGRLRSPEGEVIRIGYAGQNGRDYVGIGGRDARARAARQRPGAVCLVDAGDHAVPARASGRRPRADARRTSRGCSSAS